MCRIIVALALVCLAGCKSSATTAQQSKEETDLDLMQGIWVADAYERDGKPVGAAILQRTRVDIEGDALELIETAEFGSIATFKLDEDANPKHIDLRTADRPDRLLLGIYRLDGDYLRICWADFGKPRPTAFTTINGMGVVSLSLHRLQELD